MKKRVGLDEPDREELGEEEHKMADKRARTDPTAIASMSTALVASDMSKALVLKATGKVRTKQIH